MPGRLGRHRVRTFAGRVVPACQGDSGGTASARLPGESCRHARATRAARRPHVCRASRAGMPGRLGRHGARTFAGRVVPACQGDSGGTASARLPGESCRHARATRVARRPGGCRASRAGMPGRLGWHGARTFAGRVVPACQGDSGGTAARRLPGESCRHARATRVARRPGGCRASRAGTPGRLGAARRPHVCHGESCRHARATRAAPRHPGPGPPPEADGISLFASRNVTGS